MRLSRKIKCTCKSTNNKHRFYCDLMYEGFAGKLRPKMRKRFFLFYPRKKAWRQ